MLNFGWVGFSCGGTLAAAYDVSNLASVVTSVPHSLDAEKIFTSSLLQVVAMGVLAFTSQMLMALLFSVETVAVGSLFQKATYILLSYAFQVLLYEVYFLLTVFSSFQ